MNVGATSETDYGKYFQWGDTVGYTGDDAKAHLTWSTCPGNGGDSSCNETSLASWDAENLTNGVLNSNVDAATVNMGSKWRMPTKDEIDELIENAGWEEKTINEVIGYKIFNKSDSSKYIFIPSAGYYSEGELNSSGNKFGCWSRTRDKDYTNAAYYLCNTGMIDTLRCYCMTVRGVQ